MKIYKSHFQEAPLSDDAEQKACLHVKNMMDEAGELCGKQFVIVENGKLVWGHVDSDFVEKIGDVVRDNLQNLIDIIMSRIDSVMMLKRPSMVMFQSYYLEKGKEMPNVCLLPLDVLQTLSALQVRFRFIRVVLRARRNFHAQQPNYFA